MSLLALVLALSAAPSPVPETPKPRPAISKKRRAPAPVADLVVGGVRYATAFDGGGLIVATDLATGKALWTQRVYAIAYDPHKEKDVQDVHIAKLDLAPGLDRLLIEDERQRRYALDLASRKVTRLL